VRRYYGRHYYGGQEDGDVLRYYGRKKGNNFRYYFIVPAEVFCWLPLYYHNYLKMDEYLVETNTVIPDMDGLFGNSSSHRIQSLVTGEIVFRDFSSSPQKTIGEIVDATSKSADIVSHEVSVQSIDEYPVEINTIIPDMDGLQGNTPSYDIQKPVSGESVDSNFSSTPPKKISEFVDAASKDVDTLFHKVSDQSMEENPIETNVILPDMVGLKGNTPSCDIQKPVTGESVDSDFSSTPPKKIGQFAEAASKGVDTVSHEVSVQSIEKYPVEINAILPDMDGLQGNMPSYDMQEPVAGETVDSDFSSTSPKKVGQFVEAASKSADIISHEVSVQSIEKYPAEINTIIPDMDGLQGNTPSYNMQKPAIDETVDKDFSSSPQKTTGDIVDATSKSTDIVSHEVSVQSIDEYPAVINTIIPDMDGIQGNMPSYDMQEPVTGETVDKVFSSSHPKTTGEIVDAIFKSADIVSHEVSVQSIDEYPAEINTIIPDMDGIQGNMPLYDMQELVTDETVDSDFSSSPQKTIGQFVDAPTKSIDILSHEAIVQSKESHMPRTLLTHPRVIRMFQVVGFESLSVSNPNLAVGRLTVLKKKRFVPYKKIKVYIS
jgi:hypothetical protein